MLTRMRIYTQLEVRLPFVVINYRIDTVNVYKVFLFFSVSYDWVGTNQTYFKFSVKDFSV